jgi:hypothetical protein
MIATRQPFRFGHRSPSRTAPNMTDVPPCAKFMTTNSTPVKSSVTVY